MQSGTFQSVPFSEISKINFTTPEHKCKQAVTEGCHYTKIRGLIFYLIKNSQAVKKGAAPKKAMVKKDVKSKVAAKKWL